MKSHITNYCACRFSSCYWKQFEVYSQPLSVLTPFLLYTRILELFGNIYLENVELPNVWKEANVTCFKARSQI